MILSLGTSPWRKAWPRLKLASAVVAEVSLIAGRVPAGEGAGVGQGVGEGAGPGLGAGPGAGAGCGLGEGPGLGAGMGAGAGGDVLLSSPPPQPTTVTAPAQPPAICMNRLRSIGVQNENFDFCWDI